MLQYKNITIIGTSHIAKDSITEIKDYIENKAPDVVAVELDQKRMYGLMNKKEKSRLSIKNILRIGIKGYVFALIGEYIENKLGKVVGVSPGSDMLMAIKSANEKKLKIALIDQDINITLREFSKNITWKEKFRFFVDIIRSIIFRKREMKKLGLEDIDISKVPSKEVIKKMILNVKARYPSVYKTLILDRNKVLANNIYKIILAYPEKKVLAVIGAGHEEDVMSMVKNKIESHSDVI